MPHMKDDAVVLTSGKSWQLPPLPNSRTQIRLIYFRRDIGDNRVSGDDQDSYADDLEISVDIEVFDLDSAPAFNAISYTWGTEAPQHIIKIDDVALRVRPNCHYALWQARQHFPGSRVWLDAICIDQDDLNEKAIQVNIMGDIYAKAVNVLACIGPADDSSDCIRKALTNLDAFVQDLPSECWSGTDIKLWQPPQDEATTVRLLKQFNDFCDRPYFSRVWIVQELFCGQDHIIILCGSYQLNWDKLSELSMRLDAVFSEMTATPWYAEFNEGISRLDSPTQHARFFAICLEGSL